MSDETISLTVEDMVTCQRTQKVPRFCPNCRVDLRGPGALRHHGHALMTWRAELGDARRGDPIHWHEESEVLEQECFPKAWLCSHCGHELLKAHEAQLPREVEIPPVGTEERDTLSERLYDAGNDILIAMCNLPSLKAVNHVIGRLTRGWGFDDASIEWAKWRKQQPGELSKAEQRLMLLAKWREEWDDDELDDFPDDPEEGEDDWA